jgi:hypothetical protein
MTTTTTTTTAAPTVAAAVVVIIIIIMSRVSAVWARQLRPMVDINESAMVAAAARLEARSLRSGLVRPSPPVSIQLKRDDDHKR